MHCTDGLLDSDDFLKWVVQDQVDHVRRVLNPGHQVYWDGVQRVFGVDLAVDPGNNSRLTKLSLVCWVLPRILSSQWDSC